MDNSILIIIGSLIGAAIWCWILFEIIKAASHGKKIYEEQEIQTYLLIEIARKLGVDEKRIDEIAFEDGEDEKEEFKPQLYED